MMSTSEGGKADWTVNWRLCVLSQLPCHHRGPVHRPDYWSNPLLFQQITITWRMLTPNSDAFHVAANWPSSRWRSWPDNTEPHHRQRALTAQTGTCPPPRCTFRSFPSRLHYRPLIWGHYDKVSTASMFTFIVTCYFQCVGCQLGGCCFL